MHHTEEENINKQKFDHENINAINPNSFQIEEEEKNPIAFEKSETLKQSQVQNPSENSNIQSTENKIQNLPEQSKNEKQLTKEENVAIQNKKLDKEEEIDVDKQTSDNEKLLVHQNLNSPLIEEREETKNTKKFENLERLKQDQVIDSNPSMEKEANPSNQEEKSERVILVKEEKIFNEKENSKEDDNSISIPKEIEVRKVQESQVQLTNKEVLVSESENEARIEERPKNQENALENDNSIVNQVKSTYSEEQNEKESNTEKIEMQHASEENQEAKASDTNENPSKNDENKNSQPISEEPQESKASNSNENQIDKEMISPIINLNEGQTSQNSDKTEETTVLPIHDTLNKDETIEKKEKDDENQDKELHDEIIEEKKVHEANKIDKADNENNEIIENQENPAELEKKEKAPPLSPLGLQKKYSESSPKLEKTVLHIVVEDENEEKAKKTEEMVTIESTKNENKPKIFIDLSNVDKKTQAEYESWDKEKCLNLIKENKNNYFAYFQLTCLLFKVKIIHYKLKIKKLFIFVKENEIEHKKESEELIKSYLLQVFRLKPDFQAEKVNTGLGKLIVLIIKTVDCRRNI